MSEHTPTPWKSEKMNGNIYVFSPELGLSVAIMTDKTASGQLQNARRIVACVNACAGIPTEKLEGKPGAVLEFVVPNLKARAEATEAALDRVRSITVEEIRGVLKVAGMNNGMKATRIHRLLTERMEGK